jgi:hypothetical protein
LHASPAKVIRAADIRNLRNAHIRNLRNADAPERRTVAGRGLRISLQFPVLRV